MKKRGDNRQEKFFNVEHQGLLRLQVPSGWECGRTE